MKYIRFLFIIAAVYYLFPTQIFAQDNEKAEDTVKYWKEQGKFSLNFNQASFSSNWTGGGVNSIGFNSLINYKANYKKDIHSWDNEIDLSYGILKNEGQSARKSIDRIYIDTKYGRSLSEKWNLYSSLTFLSQFANGYKYDAIEIGGETKDSLVSKFLAPAYITSSWGVEYTPADFFKLRISPFSPRITIVNDDDLANTPVGDGKGAYGVKLGKNVRTEWLSFQLQADFEKDIAKNLNLKWKYLLYINYEDPKPKLWDQRLDLMLSAQVNKYISVSLGGMLVYDFDQDQDVQLNQLFNLGFAYTFKNFEEK